MLGLTWIATAASGGSFIGTPALAYSYGWSVMLWICGYMVVGTIGIGLVGSRIHEIGIKTGALTFPDILSGRFQSRAVGVISAVAIVFLYIAYMVAQFVAGGRVIEAVAGLDYTYGVVGFALTVSLYTAYGGFRAVAWTDAFQAMVMLFGVLLTAGLALREVGGFVGLTAALHAQSPDLVSPPGPDGFLPISSAISFFFIWPLATAGLPSQVTRFLACRDLRSLRWASLLVGAYILVLYPAIILTGMAGRVLVPELAQNDHAMPATILAVVPEGIAGFVLAAPMAAIMSTISSFLLVTSSAVVRDLYEKGAGRTLTEARAKRVTHVATFAVAGTALVFALWPPEFLQYIVVFAGTGLASAFLVPTVLGVYWRRMNRLGCILSMVGGFGSFLWQYVAYGTRSWGGLDPFVWALGFALLGAGLGILLGGRDADGVLAGYFGVEH